MDTCRSQILNSFRGRVKPGMRWYAAFMLSRSGHVILFFMYSQTIIEIQFWLDKKKVVE